MLVTVLSNHAVWEGGNLSDIRVGIVHAVPMSLMIYFTLQVIRLLDYLKDRQKASATPQLYDPRLHRSHVADYLRDPRFFSCDTLLLGPIDEELVFRGGLVPLTKKVIAAGGFSVQSISFLSIFFTAIYFALAHDPEYTFRLSPLVAGAMFGYLYEHYGLIAAISGHIIFNAMCDVFYLFRAFCSYFHDKLQLIWALEEKHVALNESSPFVIERCHQKGESKAHALLRIENDRLHWENSWLVTIAGIELLKKATQGKQRHAHHVKRPRKESADVLLKSENEYLLRQNRYLRKKGYQKVTESVGYRCMFRFFESSKLHNRQQDVLKNVSHHDSVARISNGCYEN